MEKYVEETEQPERYSVRGLGPFRVRLHVKQGHHRVPHTYQTQNAHRRQNILVLKEQIHRSLPASMTQVG